MPEDRGTKLEKERLLRVAAEVVAGERDRAALGGLGITLGDPMEGEGAKETLVAELEREEEVDRIRAEHARRAGAFWVGLARGGMEEGTQASLKCVFGTDDEHAAASLAGEFEGDGWRAKLEPHHEGSKHRRIEVTTRPLVMGPEVLETLALQMVELGEAFDCVFLGIEGVLAAPLSRPWWKRW